MKIVINPFDKKSIALAEKLVREYKKDFEVKEQEFCRRLAEIGVSVAQTGFATADYDGVNDVVVSLVKTTTGYAVVASGKTVGFIEFGTGVRYPEWVDTENASGHPYTPPPHGSYGKGQGKNPWGWWFRGSDGAVARHTYGNQPAEAMLTARNTMIERVTAIAREVWK
jgi:hypothetical protein